MVRKNREKIEEDTSNPKILKTKRHIGYYLNDNTENDMENNLKANEKDDKTVFDYNMQKKLKDNGFSQQECERLQRKVLYIANKFINTKVEMDNLISIVNIGIMKAINSFDARYNIKFETYVSRQIENEILMYLRNSNKM